MIAEETYRVNILSFAYATIQTSPPGDRGYAYRWASGIADAALEAALEGWQFARPLPAEEQGTYLELVIRAAAMASPGLRVPVSQGFYNRLLRLGGGRDVGVTLYVEADPEKCRDLKGG